MICAQNAILESRRQIKMIRRLTFLVKEDSKKTTIKIAIIFVIAFDVPWIIDAICLE